MSYVVENITNKTVTTKFGPKPAYSIKANGDWFSVGFKKPKYNVGDTIDFKYEEGAYGKQIDDATVRVLSKGSGAPAPTPTASMDAPSAGVAAPRSFGPPAKVFPVPLMHGDRSIIRQNSLTNARELVVNMPRTGGGFTAFATLDEGAAEVVRIARMFEEYSAGDIERRAAEEGM
jgi:hypothetical protein